MMRTVRISTPSIGEEEWHAVRESIISGWLSQGPKVAAFEKAFAERHQVTHALAVTSCTTGLHTALTALGIGPGDEVIVPAFTWVATANSVIYCGATPVFADVNRATYNMDPSDVAKRITSRTKAIIPVHLFGLCAEIDSLRSEIPEGIHIIEDAACAAGAYYKGTPAGGLGDVAVFSFHPRKLITTGEGGMVTTDNDELADKVDMLRNHGASISEEQMDYSSRPYILPDFNILGFNYRMTDLQGAVGLVQLRKLDRFISERQRWAEFYREELSGIEWLRMPVFPETGNHAWQAFVTAVDSETSPQQRNGIMRKLQEDGISTCPGTHAVHMLAHYRKRYNLKPDDYPGAYACDRDTMTIPLHNRMMEDDYGYVVEKIKRIGILKT